MAQPGAPFKTPQVCFLFASARPKLPHMAWMQGLRSVTGIAVGYGTVFVLGTMANSVVLHGGPSPSLPPAPLIVMLLLMHGLAGIAGGYLAAFIAGHRPASHGLAVGVLYLIAEQVASGGLREAAHPVGVQPLWFSAAILGVVVLGATLGGGARGEVVRAQLRSSELDH
jgi:hypothetical protein